ncbi:MAG: gliding motility-associated C-terminal domain-containing protein [Flavobacteriales bacterium]
MSLHRTFLILLVGLSVAAHGQGLHFDGVDDRVTIPNVQLNTIGTGNFTLEAWVRGIEAEQVEHPRILSNRDARDHGVMFFFHGLWGGTHYKTLCLQIGGVNYLNVDNGPINGSILDGTCHHVAVSKDQDSLRFYVDGQPIGQRALVGPVDAATSAQDMMIGNDGPDPHPFKGTIGQVRVWDEVRTAAQIQASMGFSIAGNMPGLAGYWEMNEGFGQTVMDKTTTANGTLGVSTLAEPQDPTWGDGCSLSAPICTATLDDVLCVGETYTLPSGTVVSVPGAYLDTVPGAVCDTVYTVRLLSGIAPPAYTYPFDSVITIGESTALLAGGGPNFRWSPATGLSCTTCPDPIATPTESTEYCVVVSNVCGSDTACVRITVSPPVPACTTASIFVPTAFSPNSSGKNDAQCLYGTDCITSMSFSIYDRWGNKVFASTDPQTCWDGTYNGQPLDPAVFAYHLSATLTNGERVERQGNITLIR